MITPHGGKGCHNLSRRPRVTVWCEPLPHGFVAKLAGRLSHVERAVAALPESLRIVVLLRDIEGRSTEEAAHLLGLTPGAVKVRLHRARLRLRDALASYLVTIPDVDDGAPD